MALFIFEMVAYLGSLLATFALLLFAAWKANGAGTAHIMAVVLLAPVACWSVAILHWKAFNYASARVPNVVVAILHYIESCSHLISEEMTAIGASLRLGTYSCARVVSTVVNRDLRDLRYLGYQTD